MRRNRNNYNSHSRLQRVTNASTLQRFRPRPSVLRRSTVLSPLRLLEDRRLFHPAGAFHRPISAFKRSALRLVIPSARERRQFRTNVQNLTDVVKFANPLHVAVCIRRKIRRNVLHALRKTGSGSGKARRTNTSDLIC